MQRYSNKDDLDGAIDALARFRHFFCVNVAETDKTKDLVFRCNGCEFYRSDGTCRVKTFLVHRASPSQIHNSQVIIR